MHDEEIYHDIYPILPRPISCITDYSSIYFDYLLLNKPIILRHLTSHAIPKSIIKLYYNYKDVTPGPKARNWHEVAECIEDILTKDDLYEDERQEVSRMFQRVQ